MAGIIEEVRVEDVERDRDAGVAEERLTWATSRPRSTIRWLAKVWRKSWKRSAGPTIAVEAGDVSRPLQHLPGHVALA
jgi:hypothetical protein